MELVKVTPSSKALGVVGVDRRCDELVCNVHGDLAEVFAHAFQNDTHHTGIRLDIGGVIEQVEGACAVELQRRCYAPGLRLRLFQQFLIQVLQQRHIPAADTQRQLPVHKPHTTVNDRLFDGLQALFAAYDQLAQGQQEVGLHGQGAVLIIGG